MKSNYWILYLLVLLCSSYANSKNVPNGARNSFQDKNDLYRSGGEEYRDSGVLKNAFDLLSELRKGEINILREDEDTDGGGGETVDKCKETCGDDYEANKVKCNEQDDPVSCSCEEQDHVFDENDSQCKEDKCKSTCGIAHDATGGDVTCTGGPFGDVECGCSGDGKAFDSSDKSCKEDKCLSTCGIAHDATGGDVTCTGGPFGDVECSCRGDGKAFDSSDKSCKADKCKSTCGIAHDDTSGEVTCKGGPFGDVTCGCRGKGKAFDESNKSCKVDKCIQKCGIPHDTRTEKGLSCDGGPFGDIQCQCTEGEFDHIDKQCRETCSGSDPCKNGGECKQDSETEESFCRCVEGTTGDKCEKIKECETGTFKLCKGDKGECIFKENKEADCVCPDGKKLDRGLGYCIDTCDEDNPCKDGKTCKNKVCVCPEGYTGDECKEIIGCDVKEEECAKADAKCVFGTPSQPKCQCNDEDFDYDERNKKCVSKFCGINPCGDTGTCLYDKGTKTGYCTCAVGRYYNYEIKQCTDPDKCLLKKEGCKENEECKLGACVCKKNFQRKKDQKKAEEKKEDEKKEDTKKEEEKKGDDKEGEKCVADCKKICFAGATCTEDGESCFCDKDKFYFTSGCKAGKDCLLDKNKCACPTGFKKKENDEGCEPKDGAEECDKDCGFGYCLEGKGCVCIPTLGKKKKDEDFCILNPKAVCASGKLTEDSKKCECTEKYKEAEDGITCDLITCADKVAQEECAKQNAICQTQWSPSSNAKGYTCVPLPGYRFDKEKKIYTDPCNVDEVKENCVKNDMSCYLSKSSTKTVNANCKCPPPLQADDNQKCSKVADYSYIIQNIPILKKKYELKDKVDEVLLKADVSESLRQTYTKTVFDYGYLIDYTVEGDVLMCSVWIKFKADPEVQLQKIQFQSQKLACKGCDENLMVWPPNVLMSPNDIGKVKYSEKLSVCSELTKAMLCGEHATCKDNVCSCPAGFKTVDFTYRKSSQFKIQKCEDINECTSGKSSCQKNTTCHNTPGDYGCKCEPGFKKLTESASETDKSGCADLCSFSPCYKGSCSMVNNMVDCKCEPGYAGPFCNRKDVNFASAKKSTVVVGAVLGSLLGVIVIAFILYYWKIRRSSRSEDFMPAPRQNHAEMMERRPMRGVSNKAYE